MFARYAYAPNALGYCGPPLGATLRDGSVEEVRDGRDEVFRRLALLAGALEDDRHHRSAGLPAGRVVLAGRRRRRRAWTRANSSTRCWPSSARRRAVLVASHAGPGVRGGRQSLLSRVRRLSVDAVSGPRHGRAAAECVGQLPDQLGHSAFPRWRRRRGDVSGAGLGWSSAHAVRAVGAPSSTCGPTGTARCPDVAVGDEIAIHWGRLCGRLQPDQIQALADSTSRQLDVTNQRLALV